jgi:hypothetical protein
MTLDSNLASHDIEFFNFDRIFLFRANMKRALGHARISWFHVSTEEKNPIKVEEFNIMGSQI